MDAIQNATDMPECLSMAEIQQVSSQDDHLQQLKSLTIASWLDSRDKLHADLRPHWLHRDELVVIDGIILMGWCIIMPNSLRQQVLNQLHTNHMGIEKTKLLAHKSVYWSNINADIKKYIKECATCLEFQQMQPKEKSIHHDIPLRLWEVVRVDIFHFNNKNYLCVCRLQQQISHCQEIGGIVSREPHQHHKIIFAEYDIPQKIMSDAGMNFVSDRF